MGAVARADCGFPGGSGFEVHFDGLDERHQPVEEGLVYWMRSVGLERRAAFELHHTAELISLGARRDVFADPGFKQTGDGALQVANLNGGALFLFGCDSGLPAKGEGVDEHASYFMARCSGCDVEDVNAAQKTGCL